MIMHIHLTLPVFLVLLLLGLNGATAQTQVEVREGSRIWLEGKSNMSHFSCVSTDVRGLGTLNNSEATSSGTATSGSYSSAEGTASVSIESFDCGRRRMNQDLYDVLNMTDFPTIRFELEDASLSSSPEGSRNEYHVHTHGRLTIAGTEQSVDMMFTGQHLSDGRYRVTGTNPLLMSDFGVDPPTALFGLIKTQDRILVRVDLVASQSTTQSTK